MPSCLSQKRGTARDSTGFERHQLAVLILRGTGGLFLSIGMKNTDQDLFTIYSPFLSSKFLETLLLKAFQSSSDMHKPDLQHLCATRWWPENPACIWGYPGRQKFQPWVTYSFSTFQGGFLAHQLLCTACPCPSSQLHWEWDQSWYMSGKTGGVSAPVTWLWKGILLQMLCFLKWKN